MRGSPGFHHHPRSQARTLTHVRTGLPARTPEPAGESSSPCPFSLRPPAPSTRLAYLPGPSVPPCPAPYPHLSQDCYWSRDAVPRFRDPKRTRQQGDDSPKGFFIDSRIPAAARTPFVPEQMESPSFD
ncbi:hypothetical protein I79_022360 [Cricetulus griseus]|uniref:Uncharacterized protein n=1 Tax=Cricetulus griseus TaxID=10029 RepID=G3IF47_CRIGR|nr:hypothetical protein I79_022360 [Cricetulus griseus]